MAKPTLLHYYLTNRCNAACTFCDIWSEKPKRDANRDDVFNNLKAARKEGCKFVDFTGGEPLMHPNLPLFLKEAKRLGFITSVTTNTILFKKRAFEIDGLIDLLHFSIDGDTKEVHDALHGVISFDKILESIDIAKNYKLFPDLLFTYTDSNIDHFKGVWNIARKNRLIVILDPLFSMDGRDENSITTHKKALEFSKLPGIYLNRAHIKLRNEGGNSTDNPICKAVSSTIVILPDNTLALPCYHHRNETINIKYLADTLKDPRRKVAIAHEGKYPSCDNCNINCYMDPSYTASLSRYTLPSLASKLKYSFDKYLRYRQPLPKFF